LLSTAHSTPRELYEEQTAYFAGSSVAAVIDEFLQLYEIYSSFHRWFKPDRIRKNQILDSHHFSLRTRDCISSRYDSAADKALQCGLRKQPIFAELPSWCRAKTGIVV